MFSPAGLREECGGDRGPGRSSNSCTKTIDGLKCTHEATGPLKRCFCDEHNDWEERDGTCVCVKPNGRCHNRADTGP